MDTTGPTGPSNPLARLVFLFYGGFYRRDVNGPLLRNARPVRQFLQCLEMKRACARYVHRDGLSWDAHRPIEDFLCGTQPGRAVLRAFIVNQTLERAKSFGRQALELAEHQRAASVHACRIEAFAGFQPAPFVAFYRFVFHVSIPLEMFAMRTNQD